MYGVGLGSYAYKDCKAFDINASIKIESGSKESYHPLLVSVKNWAMLRKEMLLDGCQR